MKKYNPISKDFPHMLIGGDYNPDQWMDYPEILKQDMELMKEANCNEMTLGIFAWDTIEPEEGVFDFSLLDERMDAIYTNGGRVILATPSAAHPRWMNEKYPDCMIVNEYGIRKEFGNRLWQCLNSRIYREKVRIINEKLAERYANHPALIAWHLGNEYRAPDCFCPQCQADFREWVRNKYNNDIHKLNHEWWTPFWSHRYTSFDQIAPPNYLTGESSMTGLSLDWRRFVSDTTVNFIGMEAEAIRKYSDIPITTNCMGSFMRYDHSKMAKHLDFYSDDAYPMWCSSLDKHTVVTKTAQNASLCRSMKGGKPFLIMESAPGINIYRQGFIPPKSKEEQLFEAMLFVATGSDSVMYFQWRKGRGCGEKYHGAIVDHLGTSEHRNFKAVKEVGARLKKMDGIVGTSIRSEIAITRDYETIWALNGNPADFQGASVFKFKDTNNYDVTIDRVFSAAWNKNIPADIISYEEDFSKYKLVILPSPYIMTETLAKKIKTYVKNGGTVVSFYLAGMVNENDLAYIGGMPGCGLRELFGLRVDENGNYAASVNSLRNSVSYGGKTYPVNANADITTLEGAEKIGEYLEDFFKGASAVSKNTYGKGTAYHVAFLPDGEFMSDFLSDLCRELDIKAPEAISADKDVRITCREGDGEKYYFALNPSGKEQNITLKSAMHDVLNDCTVSGTITLPPMGSAVLLALDK